MPESVQLPMPLRVAAAYRMKSSLAILALNPRSAASYAGPYCCSTRCLWIAPAWDSATRVARRPASKRRAMIPHVKAADERAQIRQDRLSGRGRVPRRAPPNKVSIHSTLHRAGGAVQSTRRSLTRAPAVGHLLGPQRTAAPICRGLRRSGKCRCRRNVGSGVRVNSGAYSRLTQSTLSTYRSRRWQTVRFAPDHSRGRERSSI